MENIRFIVMIAFIAVCVVLNIVVLKQEGKQNGLAALTGQADSYWSKNKGRSAEGVLVKITRVLVLLFFVGGAFLCIARFA